MDKTNNDVNKFWIDFPSVVLEQGINVKYADLYVKWAVNFVRSITIKGKPVTKRTLDDIK